MKRRSSIFSFDTLKFPRHLPRAAIFALFIVALAEVSARFGVRQQWINEAPSLHRLLTKDLARVQSESHDVWMLGNSTLDHGVDESRFGDLTGRSAIALSHGSATPRALAAMMSYYVNRTSHRPSSVILFANEDDFNRNGYRAQRSKTYIDYAAGRVWQPQEYFTLFTARESIAQQIGDCVGVSGRKKAKAKYKSGAIVYDGDPIPADDKLQQGLVQNFAFDDDAIDVFAAAARAHGIREIACVIMPTTNVYARFHDKAVPQMTCAQITDRVRQLCARAGVQFLDTGGPSSTYAIFSDSHHLNDTGRQLYTAVVAQWVLSRSGDPQSVARSASQEDRAKEALGLLGLPARVN